MDLGIKASEMGEEYEYDCMNHAYSENLLICRNCNDVHRRRDMIEEYDVQGESLYFCPVCRSSNYRTVDKKTHDLVENSEIKNIYKPIVEPVKYHFMQVPYIYLIENEQGLHNLARQHEIPELLSDFLEKGKKDSILVKTYHKSLRMISIVYAPGLRDCALHDVVSSLVHEAVHIFQDYASIIGEREPSVEFEAYAIESFFEALMNAYRPDWREALSFGGGK